MKQYFPTILCLVCFCCLQLPAGISQPVYPKTKKGKSKLKVKQVEMIPPLASELSYTNLCMLVRSNQVASVAAGPMAMQGKIKKKTGEAKGWKYKEKDKATKFKLKAKVVSFEPLGSKTIIYMHPDGNPNAILKSSMNSDFKPKIGEMMSLLINEKDIYLFDKKSTNLVMRFGS